MTLSSLGFLLFLSLVLIIYYIIPKKFQWTVLLIASYSFYLFSGVDNVLFILFTTLLTYSAGLWMQKIRDNQLDYIKSLGNDVSKEQKRELKKAFNKKIRVIQVSTVVIHLGVLIALKCHGFLFYNVNKLFTLFSWSVSDPLVNIIVPLGLSYYTFNSIGYLIDVQRSKHPAEKHLGKFALFVSFFPSIVQGPLLRYIDVGNQLSKEHKFDYTNIKYGAQLILWGFFKKLVIAEHVAVISNAVFSTSLPEYSGSQVFVGVLAYSFQIYGDFSGGTDITRGAAQMMGITLPVNFERPFFATSMGNFWQRWHMSLGAWMREYVFYPVMLCKPVTKLSKTFRKKYGAYAGKMVPSVAAPLVVFFLIGIWHGITWQYIANGLYNAILISSSVALAPVFKKMISLFRIKEESFGFRVFQIARTFLLLCISRIIVKAPSINDVLPMIKAMFTSFDLSFVSLFDNLIMSQQATETRTLIVKILTIAMILAMIAILMTVDVLQEKGVKIRESIAKKNIFIRWSIFYALIFIILLCGVYGPGIDATQFIYGNF